MMQASEIPVVPILVFQHYDPFFFFFSPSNHILLSQKASSLPFSIMVHG